MPGRNQTYLRNVVQEGRLNTRDALLAHHQLSMQLFESQMADNKRRSQDLILQLMAGEVALHASPPVRSGSVNILTGPQEITRHPEDHVIRSTCELVMVGGVQSCQHGILCKERK